MPDVCAGASRAGEEVSMSQLRRRERSIGRERGD